MFLLRGKSNDQCTIGELVFNHQVFCWTLEDVIRPPDVKILGKTAIMAGRYEVIVNMSNKFGKMLPLLLNVPIFDGIRMHGGNTATDTLGCILVAKNKVNENTIQGSMSDELTKILIDNAKEKHFISIYNSI